MRKTLRKHYEKKKGKSLACASKENLNFDNQSIQVVFLFSSWCFLSKRNRKHAHSISID